LVEVINFGVGGYGFHQTAMLVLALAKSYGLDLILLGPKDFHEERDRGFATFWSASYTEKPLLVRARWILEQGRVTLLDPLGRDSEERFAIYQQFLRPWYYLRYDGHPPPFLRALLPPGRTLENPFFYYPDGWKREVWATWHALMDRIIALRIPTVLLFDRDDLDTLFRDLQGPGFNLCRLCVTNDILFRRPEGHHSALGNQQVAQQSMPSCEVNPPSRCVSRISTSLPLPCQSNPSARPLPKHTKLCAERVNENETVFNTGLV